MRTFARLFRQLDRTSSTDAKVAAVRAYFEDTRPEDAAWGLWFLCGEKLKRVMPYKVLGGWAATLSGVPEWLFRESNAAVGDMAETCALLVAAPAAEAEPSELGLKAWVKDRLLSLRGEPAERQMEMLTAWTAALPRDEVFLVLKMLTGAMRIGVSKTLVERAIAEAAGVEQAVIAQRLAGEWSPAGAFVASLLAGEDAGGDEVSPYPFFLASQLIPPDFEGGLEDEIAIVSGELGDPGDWLAEWKWDGIRAQLLKRGGRVLLWSRGDENLTERFPDIVEPAARLPDGVAIDGEVLCWRDGKPLEFGVLQTRIGRKNVGPKVLADAPAVLLGYDLLEFEGEDLRQRGIEERRGLLRDLIEGRSERLLCADGVAFETWDELGEIRADARERGVEGVMLKRAGSVYRSGRRKGDWWKWKVEPLTLDLVLVYAQPGRGRRSGLMTDYTFAAWDGDELVTVTKAYSGLTDAEFREVDAWIRKHTTDKFGPVRQVEPELVFELAFDSVNVSSRHKSGVAMRFPRMKRWRTDKPASEADRLDDARAMIRGSDG
ncbi:MAG: ATP-dependent DNA ligase [Planctomycetota bacterium]